MRIVSLHNYIIHYTYFIPPYVLSEKVTCFLLRELIKLYLLSFFKLICEFQRRMSRISGLNSSSPVASWTNWPEQNQRRHKKCWTHSISLAPLEHYVTTSLYFTIRIQCWCTNIYFICYYYNRVTMTSLQNGRYYSKC